MERLDVRQARRAGSRHVEALLARFGLADPWSAEGGGIEADASMVFLSGAPFYAMLARMAAAEQQREQRFAWLAERASLARMASRQSVGLDLGVRAVPASWSAHVGRGDLQLVRPETQQEPTPVAEPAPRVASKAAFSRTGKTARTSRAVRASVPEQAAAPKPPRLPVMAPLAPQPTRATSAQPKQASAAPARRSVMPRVGQRAERVSVEKAMAVVERLEQVAAAMPSRAEASRVARLAQDLRASSPESWSNLVRSALRQMDRVSPAMSVAVEEALPDSMARPMTVAVSRSASADAAPRRGLRSLAATSPMISALQAPPAPQKVVSPQIRAAKAAAQRRGRSPAAMTGRPTARRTPSSAPRAAGSRATAPASSASSADGPEPGPGPSPRLTRGTETSVFSSRAVAEAGSLEFIDFEAEALAAFDEVASPAPRPTRALATRLDRGGEGAVWRQAEAATPARRSRPSEAPQPLVGRVLGRELRRGSVATGSAFFARYGLGRGERTEAEAAAAPAVERLAVARERREAAQQTFDARHGQTRMRAVERLWPGEAGSRPATPPTLASADLQLPRPLINAAEPEAASTPEARRAERPAERSPRTLARSVRNNARDRLLRSQPVAQPAAGRAPAERAAATPRLRAPAPSAAVSRAAAPSLSASPAEIARATLPPTERPALSPRRAAPVEAAPAEVAPSSRRVAASVGIQPSTPDLRPEVDAPLAARAARPLDRVGGRLVAASSAESPEVSALNTLAETLGAVGGRRIAQAAARLSALPAEAPERSAILRQVARSMGPLRAVAEEELSAALSQTPASPVDLAAGRVSDSARGRPLGLRPVLRSSPMMAALTPAPVEAPVEAPAAKPVAAKSAARAEDRGSRSRRAAPLRAAASRVVEIAAPRPLSASPVGRAATVQDRAPISASPVRREAAPARPTSPLVESLRSTSAIARRPAAASPVREAVAAPSERRAPSREIAVGRPASPVVEEVELEASPSRERRLARPSERVASRLSAAAPVAAEVATKAPDRAVQAEAERRAGPSALHAAARMEIAVSEARSLLPQATPRVSASAAERLAAPRAGLGAFAPTTTLPRPISAETPTEPPAATAQPAARAARASVRAQERSSEPASRRPTLAAPAPGVFVPRALLASLGREAPLRGEEASDPRPASAPRRLAALRAERSSAAHAAARLSVGEEREGSILPRTSVALPAAAARGESPRRAAAALVERPVFLSPEVGQESAAPAASTARPASRPTPRAAHLATPSRRATARLPSLADSRPGRSVVPRPLGWTTPSPILSEQMAVSAPASASAYRAADRVATDSAPAPADRRRRDRPSAVVGASVRDQQAPLAVWSALERLAASPQGEAALAQVLGGEGPVSYARAALQRALKAEAGGRGIALGSSSSARSISTSSFVLPQPLRELEQAASPSATPASRGPTRVSARKASGRPLQWMTDRAASTSRPAAAAPAAEEARFSSPGVVRLLSEARAVNELVAMLGRDPARPASANTATVRRLLETAASTEQPGASPGQQRRSRAVLDAQIAQVVKILAEREPSDTPARAERSPAQRAVVARNSRLARSQAVNLLNPGALDIDASAEGGRRVAADRRADSRPATRRSTEPLGLVGLRLLRAPGEGAAEAGAEAAIAPVADRPLEGSAASRVASRGDRRARRISARPTETLARPEASPVAGGEGAVSLGRAPARRRTGLGQTLGAVEDGRAERGMPGWAERVTRAPAGLGAAVDLLSALSRVQGPEEVLSTLEARSGTLREGRSVLPAPLLRVIEQIRSEAASAAGKSVSPAASDSASLLRPAGAADARAAAASAPASHGTRSSRAYRGFQNLQRTARTEAINGAGDSRLMALVRRLQSLVFLAEHSRDEAMREVRLAEDSAAARAEGQSAPTQSGDGRSKEVDVDALAQEVLNVVQREFELRKERRVDDPDPHYNYW